MKESDIVDRGSGMIPILHRMCALSKDVPIQRQCKYYVAGKNKACSELTNWWSDGLQGCGSKAAIEGYTAALQKRGQ